MIRDCKNKADEKKIKEKYDKSKWEKELRKSSHFIFDK